MRLKQVRIRHFRSCYDTTVDLSEHVTLLVGENDGGKSTILDALRATLPPATGRQNLWFDADRDLSYGAALGDVIKVTRTYSDLSAAEDAFYTPALLDDHRHLVHTTSFQTNPLVLRRHRLSYTVGDAEVADPEPENRERIAHVYLQPLRDAATALDSSGGNRLADVFRIMASKDEIEAFEDKANTSLSELSDDPTARKVVGGVQSHLSSVTRPVRHRLVDVKHRRQRLTALARSLRLHMAAEGLTPSDLAGSGLGYANLLFIATVVLELEKAHEFDLLLLLVEEPEAHLHPQLQTVLLHYLEEQARSTAAAAIGPGQPAGRIQVVATSHSPNLASSVSTSNVVVVRGRDREVPPLDGAEGDGADAEPQVLTEATTVPLAAIPLNTSDRRKVDRYLDATRGALLFARQVILVEGIAEAMLLRTLAERCVFPKESDGDTPDGILNRRCREQFRAISVLPVGGVDFFPFLRLLLHPGVPLADRVVVITDGDAGAGAARRADIHSTFQEHVDTGCLTVAVGDTTLEAELYGAAGNEKLLRKAFELQHPRSLEKWDLVNPGADATPAERAAAFSRALKQKELNLGKGDFAQVVADLIVEAQPGAFHAPDYLAVAIRSATISPGVAPQAGGDPDAA